MRVLVCGSRKWTDVALMRYRLRQFPMGTIVLQGQARGADQMAAAIAHELGFGIEDYPANWSQYGKEAGFIRNNKMLDTKPDLVIAFWDGESRGTLHTIMGAAERGIKTETILPNA